MSSDAPPLLAFHQVRFAYGAQVVLQALSFEVHPGEVVAVVGPNGAGKSTLLRLASGLLTPGAGRVEVQGRPVSALPRREAARVMAGVAAEQRAELPFTVRESVAFGRHPWRSAFAALSPADEARIDRALTTTGLTTLAARPLTALSSGERQRAAIARCMVQDAPLWLLDEPTAHLDLGHRMRLLALMRAAAAEEERAVLAVLHDLDHAALVADRILLLDQGRMEALGPPAEVLTADRIGSVFGAEVLVRPHPDRAGLQISALGPAAPTSESGA